MTEREFQERIITLARTLGWLVFHTHDSRRQVRPGVFVGDSDAAGYPDLTLVHPRRHRVVWAELKVGSNKPTAKQQDWLDALAEAGEEAHLWRPSDMDAIETVLKTNKRVYA